MYLARFRQQHQVGAGASQQPTRSLPRRSRSAGTLVNDGSASASVAPVKAINRRSASSMVMVAPARIVPLGRRVLRRHNDLLIGDHIAAGRRCPGRPWRR